jgi:hypothetical protein
MHIGFKLEAQKGSKVRRVFKADNIITIYEPIV